MTDRQAKNNKQSGKNAIGKNVIGKNARNIIGTIFLTKFHEDRKINVASRVLTRKNAPPPGSHVFQPTGIIFELIQDIIVMNLLTKFHEDRTVNVASRVLTRKNAPPPWWPYRTINVASRVKNSPPLGGHVFQANVTIFELIKDIIKTNLLTIFHQDWTINVASRVKNAPPPWRSYIIGMNLLTNHVFQANVTNFKLKQDIIETNFFTKFHEDWTLNVASRELTRQMLMPHNAQRTTDDGQKAITKAHHEHVVLR
ncbi:hypothetical protein DPMN_160176 [Dreissena polymorpha]|uniref:Uncharacterized protein n=1 Tax=Dreissena polymorpha TaxID=45954 RepID=A0A9D4EMZ6_DREPO|nr:hypothetical protein DPMN_160176 [Dreissena polymorpha]